MRLLPRARRSAGLAPAVRLTATSVSIALAVTVLPGLGVSWPDDPPGSGTVRAVDLPLKQGSVTGPGRVDGGRLLIEPMLGPAGVPASRRPTATWRSAPVEVGDARMVGLSWAAPVAAGSTLPGGAPRVRLRTERGRGWSDWKDVETDGGAPNRGARDDQRPDRVFSQGAWLAEGTRSVQVQVGLAAPAPGAGPAAFSGLTAHLIAPDMTPTPQPDPGPGAAVARVDAPAIISRADWGADERLRRGPPRYVHHLQVGFLHHTVQTNHYAPEESAALVRADYLYHVKSRGYADIGYNFLVDRYGNIFEGRAGGVRLPVYGAHTGGFNHASFGVALIGNFETSGVPPAAARALTRLFAWKLDLHHIDPQGVSLVRSTGGGTARWPAGTVVRLNAISGHRDVGVTACPGRHGYRFLHDLRVGVARTGLPKIYGGRVSRTSIRPGSGQHVITGVSFSAHLEWEATITGANGEVIRSWEGEGTHARLVWDGTTADGEPAAAGVAVLRVYATWQGEDARPVKARIRVVA